MDEKRSLLKTVLRFKHDLEGMPECAWNEIKTKQYITDTLGTDYYWSKKTALIYRLGRGQAVFFRAELDALNTSSGPKHVCGHSSHMAALMGAYLYFKHNPPSDKTIYFVFQPSEEGYPSGASFIQSEFFNKHPCPLGGYAFHTHPSKKAGELLDIHWASADYFEIAIEGRGTHIKNKYSPLTRDVIIPTSYIASLINGSRFADSLLNAGIVQAGETPNSIAEQAAIKGDIRALTLSSRTNAKQKLKEYITKTKKKFPRFTYRLYFNPAYPQLKNNPAAIKKLSRILPVSSVTVRSFATEDFSLYGPNTVFFLGGTGETRELHDLRYNVPEPVVEKILDYWIRLGSYSLAK